MENCVTANWSRAEAALRTRLRLAEVKTLATVQRARVANAIVIPKILFVARHSWLTSEVVTQVQLLVRELVWGRTTSAPRRAWLGAEQSEFTAPKGGISMPNVVTELLAMAAMAVARRA
ncbi:hypothetical protein PybrP1_006543 [[Pythium] brassicae (nom. inval.)]|nr:hypothetical protein PybrP1_006543 [[Pythium] brassicae (nom. inval.)]